MSDLFNFLPAVTLYACKCCEDTFTPADLRCLGNAPGPNSKARCPNCNAPLSVEETEADAEDS